MVPVTNEHASNFSLQNKSVKQNNIHEQSGNRTAQEQTLESVFHWAPSTRYQYNQYIDKFLLFCQELDQPYQTVGDHIIAEYLGSLAASSDRPKSKINGTLAALTSFHEAFDVYPVSPNIRKLANAVVKSSTVKPMLQTPNMPIKSCINLFQSWPRNLELSRSQLRMKCVCLLASTLMLRPSDLAPKSLIFDSSDGSSHKSVFSEQQIHFDENGGMDILFHGIKNDYDRDGFKVHLPAASECKMFVKTRKLVPV